MTDQLKVLKYYLYYKYRRPFSDRQALERWQKRKLKKHLEYVAEHSKLYKGMKDLADYPVINKTYMMEHFDDLNTVGLRRDNAEAFAIRAERERDFSPKLDGVTVGLSSGTSGRRGIFLVSDGEKTAGQARFWQNFCREAYWILMTLRFSCVRTVICTRRSNPKISGSISLIFTGTWRNTETDWRK